MVCLCLSLCMCVHLTLCSDALNVSETLKAAQEGSESLVSGVLQNRGPISAGPLVNGWMAPKLISLTNVVYT